MQSGTCPLPLSTMCATAGVGAWRAKFLSKSYLLLSLSGAKPRLFPTCQAVPAQTICCNHPHSAVATIPVRLLHPVFSQFLSNCNADETALRNSDFTLQLSYIISEFDLHPTLIQMVPEHITDGDMSVGPHWYTIAEIE